MSVSGPQLPSLAPATFVRARGEAARVALKLMRDPVASRPNRNANPLVPIIALVSGSCPFLLAVCLSLVEVSDPSLVDDQDSQGDDDDDHGGECH